MIGIDTNILLRWLLDDPGSPDDAPHQTALVSRLFIEGGKRFFVNHVVIAETVWVLRNKGGHSRTAIKGMLDRLMASADVEIYGRSTVEAALASYAEHPGDFADHLIGKINRDANCTTTMTFDRAASRSPDFTQLKGR